MPRRPKRVLRRTLAIMLGLYLGWIAADVAFEQLPSLDSAAFADSAPQPGNAAAGDDHGHVHSIEALTPGEGQTPWFGKMVFFAAALFVLAAVLGPVAMSLKSPEPPEPKDHDHHDDHTHVAHGHGAAAHGHGGHAH